MEQEHNDKKNPDKKNSLPGKILPQPGDEDFNTDSDKSSPNVGPGYDDTGLGNDVQSSLKDESGDLKRGRQRKRIYKNPKK